MKPLSPKNNQLRITLPLILGGFSILLTIILLKYNWLWLLTGVSIIGGFSIFYVLKIYNRTENVFYDADFLYLKNKYQTRKIALHKIKRVKLTLSDQRILGMQYHECSIEFINEFGINESVSVWLGGVHDRISEFEKCLNHYAPTVNIQHSVSTFDR